MVGSPDAQMCHLTNKLTNYSQYVMHPKELSNNFDVITHVYAQLNMVFYTKQPYVVTCIFY
jgi:hypothetical protein